MALLWLCAGDTNMSSYCYLLFLFLINTQLCSEVFIVGSGDHMRYKGWNLDHVCSSKHPHLCSISRP